MARFEEAEDDTTQLAALEIAARRGGTAAAQFRGGQIVHFYNRLVEDEALTAESGRPRYKELRFIKIITPGSQDYIDREIRLDKTAQSDDRRFPIEWKSFCERGETIQEGTPLAAVPSLSRAQVEELKHLHCVTVEQLAALTDDAAQRFMGMNKLRQWAKDYLEAAESNAPVTRLSRENETLKNDLDTMRRQLAELSTAFNSLKTVQQTFQVPMAPQEMPDSAASAFQAAGIKQHEEAAPVAPRKLQRKQAE